MPVGALFSDLVVDGVEGPVAVCPGTEPDPEDIAPEPDAPDEPVDAAGDEPAAEASDPAGPEDAREEAEGAPDTQADMDTTVQDPADAPVEGGNLSSAGGCACATVGG